MGIQKDVKSAWKDSKKFANKHPVVSLLIGGSAAFTVYYIYFSSYIMTSAFEKVNQ